MPQYVCVFHSKDSLFAKNAALTGSTIMYVHNRSQAQHDSNSFWHVTMRTQVFTSAFMSMQCQVHSSIFAVTGSQQEQQQVEVETAGTQLAATVQLILQLVRYSFGMSLEDVNVLTAHLSPQVLGSILGISTLCMCTSS